MHRKYGILILNGMAALEKVMASARDKGVKMKRYMAYVFGCGKYFENKQSAIMNQYDIVAVLDNNRIGEIELQNGKTVPILKPADAVCKDIPIILAVRDFYSVWQQLMELPFEPSRIVFPNVFPAYTSEEKLFNADGGAFRITEGDIWYEDEKRKYIVDSAETLYKLSQKLERDRVDASFLTELASIRPLNREFGFSRGMPIDRYYIEKWLEENKRLIYGDVLEIAEDTYTKRFGRDDAVPHILHVDIEQEGFIKGNLETGEGIEENSVDCIILTQTLPFIYNCKNVISNLYKALRKGGNALFTTGGISQISRYDMDRWGHFWSFTTASLKRLIEESEFGINYEMSVYGNVKTACALLYGVAAEELKQEELEFSDEDYPVSVCVVLRK